MAGRKRPTRRPFLWDARRRTPQATNPTDKADGQAPRGPRDSRVVPIRFCSRRGLPCRRRCRRRGALLPHPFTLTPSLFREEKTEGGLLSVALSLGSPPPDVIRRRVRPEPGLSSAKRRPPGRLARGA